MPLSQDLIDSISSSEVALDNHGMVSNTATVSAEDLGGNVVPCEGGSCSSSATCSWPLSGEIGIIISDNYLHRAAYEGDIITFTYELSNKGQTTLNSVSLDTSPGINSEAITMDSVYCQRAGAILYTPGDNSTLQFCSTMHLCQA